MSFTGRKGANANLADYLTVVDFAAESGQSARTVWRRIADGELAAWKWGRVVMVRAEKSPI